jgi:hypothetical protein
MSHPPIQKLTPFQEALIPIYCDKWIAYTLSTEPINRQKATVAAKAAYKIIGEEEPEIVFFDSPYEPWYRDFLAQIKWKLEVSEQWDADELRELLFQMESQLGRQLEKNQESLVGKLWEKFGEPLGLLWNKPKTRISIERFLQHRMERQLGICSHKSKKQWWSSLESQLRHQLISQLDRELWNKLSFPLEPLFHAPSNFITAESLVHLGTELDFHISVLNWTHQPREWEVVQSLMKNCGSCIFPYKNTCILCDRPTQLSFDSENCLHAEGEAAIQFADGYSLYFHHGVVLPEKLEKLHPH